MCNRHHRLKLLFFMLGVALTSMVFLLQSSQCTGSPCSSSDPRYRRLLSIFSNTASTSTTTTPSPGSATSPILLSTSANSTGSAASPTLLSTSAYSQVMNRQLNTLTSTLLPSKSLSQSHSTSTYSIPTLKYIRRTFPVPSDTRYISMTNRTSQSDCKTEYCHKYLSPKEEARFSACYKKCDEKSNKFGPVVNGACHFMDGRGRLPVALASFPGSGNTWARGLLEKVTRVCTGGLYCDCGLRVRGFTGEGIQGPSVLIMKTHNLKVQFVGGHVFSKDRLPYGAAVLLVRDPRAALVAEWNRERSKRMVSQNVSNHYTYVEQNYFGANKDWDAYIHYKLSRWPEQIVNLLTEAKSAEHPIHVLIFEDMKADTVREMKKVTDFLGFSFTLEEVSTRLRAGFSQFYRNHTSEFSHFTPDQEQYIHDVVYSTSQFMRDKGLYDLYPRIDDYL